MESSYGILVIYLQAEKAPNLAHLSWPCGCQSKYSYLDLFEFFLSVFRSRSRRRKYWCSGNNEEQRQDKETPSPVSHATDKTIPLPHHNSSNSNRSLSLGNKFSFDHVLSKQRKLDFSSCASPTSPLTSQVIEASIINISSVDSFEQVDAATQTPTANYEKLQCSG